MTGRPGGEKPDSNVVAMGVCRDTFRGCVINRVIEPHPFLRTILWYFDRTLSRANNDYAPQKACIFCCLGKYLAQRLVDYGHSSAGVIEVVLVVRNGKQRVHHR